jgi:hypothetical protein
VPAQYGRDNLSSLQSHKAQARIAPQIHLRVLSWCARQGTLVRGCKSPMGPVAGTISWTARAVVVRCSLKEAAGKLLA